MTMDIFMQGIVLIETVVQASKGDKYSPFTEQQLTVYKTLLDDIPDDMFVIGITNLLKSRVYANLPTPAEIREFCLGMKDNQIQVRVLEAQNKIKKAIGTVGTYNSVAFDDPIIHLAIRDLGGWVKLGTMQIDDFENYLKWDFPKIYKAYASRKNSEIPTRFVGVGRDERNIVYIGNEERAKKWILAYENKQLGYANSYENVDKLALKEEYEKKQREFLEWMA
ncbi:hypothetical protein IX317_001659 [Fusobacterium sp. DD29]|uniref:DUF6475 domain-containing protein n=1 Tax=unclassified Fusobacterium TaxID=2648384 RepID=UPI001B8CD3FC|nr:MULTISPECIES: DUF6475 domain-containing protein [unclassified Fusobacterium]MBR8749979.1 hypothetical protein [Fusobacterium sp. DD29]MBR8762208.1 hypothetical protein [Fusobacterium sp. DD25]MBR8768238.1 hypothetical protein [Fusobacterium sp. DD43]MBR8772314.1 hypothetical protein [Fusobacterium sp. DD40]MBR8776533.1 hypothetical protein [Fusobacterium sp. DD17]